MTKAITKKARTSEAPSAISPMDLAKPMMWMLMPAPWLSWRIRSRALATACRSRRWPVTGSVSCRLATTMADDRSLETMRPIQSDLSVRSRTWAICCGVPA
ncbi:hypothetical protein D3C80_1704920 [compost metagenome]